MQRFLDITTFNNKHESDRAWLFGKGASLDQFPQNEAGKLRICVNESLTQVENPTYFFSHDEKPIQRVSKYWPNKCIAVLQPERARFAVGFGIPASQICVYEKEQTSLDKPIWHAPQIVKQKKLLGLSGTVHSAIHFCHFIGVPYVTLVGFDGQGDYAKSLNLEMPLGGGQHGRIKKDSINLLNKLEIEFDFFLYEKNSQEKINQLFDYQHLYDTLRTHGYHQGEDNSSHLIPYLDWIATTLRPVTALDVGCSAGASLQLLANANISATGVEISSIAVAKAQELGRNVVQGCATNLPFDDNEFDLVCSADVFEHLTPRDGQIACQEACRVAKKFVFLKIAEKEDVTQQWKDVVGHPLHLTTQPIHWWKQFLSPYGDVIRCEFQVICVSLDNNPA